ncbi:hypothetical protein [Frankia tisae]|uniref:hypothetical protein n=1 Tax=Frankia tisae TaxID=2950104 RepID=UPI0021BF67AE|nr:hypothetical protein [Frankia tisae]
MTCGPLDQAPVDVDPLNQQGNPSTAVRAKALTSAVLPVSTLAHDSEAVPGRLVEEMDNAMNQHSDAGSADDAIAVFEDIAAALRGDSEFGVLSSDTVGTLDLVAAAACTIFSVLQANEARDGGCIDRRVPDLDRSDCRQIAELFVDFVDLSAAVRNDRRGLRVLLGCASGWVAARWRTAAIIRAA